MVKVNVFTQAYNAEKTLKRTINSILAQTYDDWIWYFVNNGSTDRTEEIIKAYAENDKRIKVLRNRQNNVWEMGNSYLDVINQCDNSDFFCWIDADDEYKPTFFKKANPQPAFPAAGRDPDIEIMFLTFSYLH
jgi:glycosyltransferase involved in cell wall biosynthesis